MRTAADEALLTGFALGDSDAAAAFIRRHQGRVFGLAISIVGDAAMAEDVAQESFTRAWRHAGAYDPRRGSVLTWLLTITRNLAIDTLRLQRARPVDPEVIINLGLEATGRDTEPPAAAEAEEQTQRLRSALVALPEDQRRAVVLAALCGRTAREVGDTEGIPIGTAKTRIRTGLLKLRALLGAANEVEE